MERRLSAKQLLREFDSRTGLMNQGQLITKLKNSPSRREMNQWILDTPIPATVIHINPDTPSKVVTVIGYTANAVLFDGGTAQAFWTIKEINL